MIDDRLLEPGRYRLISYQRPCDGSCQALDPPRARCASTFDLGADDRVVVTIELHIPKPCAMLLEPAAEVGTVYHFDLSTHCGIGVTFFDGRTWIARGGRDEAINPPPGWDDPFERGSMQLISPRELEFTSGSGETILYGLPPSGSQIQFSLCY